MKFLLTLPEELRKTVKVRAAQAEISMNEYIVQAITKAVSDT